MFRVIYHQAHHIWCATTVSLGQSGGKRDQAKGRPYQVSLAPQTHDYDPKSGSALGEARKYLETFRLISAVHLDVKLRREDDYAELANRHGHVAVHRYRGVHASAHPTG